MDFTHDFEFACTRCGFACAGQVFACTRGQFPCTQSVLLALPSGLLASQDLLTTYSQSINTQKKRRGEAIDVFQL